MECCQCEGIEKKFDEAYVERKLKAYRKKGPKKTTRVLIKALEKWEIKGLTLLDIGGGVGDVQHALLKTGVRQAVNAEASNAYLEACRQEAEREGHADRIHHLPGNFTDLASEIEMADIVTLDRVICCYHDMPELVGKSIKKARRLYGVVYPRETWWVKVAIAIYYNFRFWLQRNPFRIFVHPTKEVEKIISDHQFQCIFHRNMGSWQVVVYGR